MRFKTNKTSQAERELIKVALERARERKKGINNDYSIKINKLKEDLRKCY